MQCLRGSGQNFTALVLDAAREVACRIEPRVAQLAERHLHFEQRNNGSVLTPPHLAQSGFRLCAGSSLQLSRAGCPPVVLLQQRGGLFRTNAAPLLPVAPLVLACAADSPGFAQVERCLS